MSRVMERPSSQDAAIEAAFDSPVPELYAAASAGTASAAATRVMELRSFLVLVEEHLMEVRERLHQATAPGRDLGEVSAADLRFDVQMLTSALEVRGKYIAALGELLRAMPSPDQAEDHTARFTQGTATARSAPGGGLTATPVHRPHRS